MNQASAHMIRNCKAHQPAGIAINHGSQVHIRPTLNRQIRNVPNVELIWLVGSELPSDQVRKHWLFLIRNSRGDLAFFVYPNSFIDLITRATRLWLTGLFFGLSLSSAVTRLAP